MLNNDFIIGKALKALNVLLYNCKRYPMKPSVLCQLFDAFVGSRLSYSEEIERVHLKFCKRISNIRMNSCSIGVYGELARYLCIFNVIIELSNIGVLLDNLTILF